MAFGWAFGIGRVIVVSGTEASVIPGIDLFEAPNFKNIGAPVANRDRADRILHLGQKAAGILPIVDKRTVGIHDPFGIGAGISAALGVAEIIFDERLWRAGRAKCVPDPMGSRA